jgi:dienelactone hydrolase
MADPEGFTTTSFDHAGKTRTVYRAGVGPAVVIMHEMPGITPQVAHFARIVADGGFSVYMPQLFGETVRPISVGYALGEMLRGSISAEFKVLAAHRSSPIVDWLRALANQAHREQGGKGVGAVGMCFTGNFALAMMTEPAVVAPVLSQPSLPLPMGPGKAKRGAAIGVSPAELRCARQRLEDEDLTMLGLRFEGDSYVPPERFAALREALGPRFEGIELNPKDAAPNKLMAMAHSVLTIHLKDDDPDGPTKQVEQRVIAFFKERTAPQERAAVATP